MCPFLEVSFYTQFKFVMSFVNLRVRVYVFACVTVCPNIINLHFVHQISPSMQEEKVVPMETTNWEEKAKKEYEDYLTMEVQLLIQLGVIKSDTGTDDI